MVQQSRQAGDDSRDPRREKVLDDGILGAKVVSYFYALASSELGTLFREDQRLTPYFKLHEFIEAK